MKKTWCQIMTPQGGVLVQDQAVVDYIQMIDRENRELRRENSRLKLDNLTMSRRSFIDFITVK